MIYRLIRLADGCWQWAWITAAHADKLPHVAGLTAAAAIGCVVMALPPAAPVAPSTPPIVEVRPERDTGSRVWYPDVPNTPDRPIRVLDPGPPVNVPEPTGLYVLALGSMALLLLRRKQQ